MPPFEGEIRDDGLPDYSRAPRSGWPPGGHFIRAVARLPVYFLISDISALAFFLRPADFFCPFPPYRMMRPEPFHAPRFGQRGRWPRVPDCLADAAAAWLPSSEVVALRRLRSAGGVGRARGWPQCTAQPARNASLKCFFTSRGYHAICLISPRRSSIGDCNARKFRPRLGSPRARFAIRCATAGVDFRHIGSVYFVAARAGARC